MGLCKCPKRKTTSHFCFHHCVNVCEHCIVNNHTTCVVKSYTTWLKEASGNVSSSSVSASALCAVCQKHFASAPRDDEHLSSHFNESSSYKNTAVRLLCYHVIHACCLSVYVKQLLKEGHMLKCPACTRPLWLQEHLVDSNGASELDSNELSPVALQLYNHLLNHGKWWGQALIDNGKVEDIEKHLLEDKDNDENENSHLFEDHSTLETKPVVNTLSDHVSPLTANTLQSINSNFSYNNSEFVKPTSNSSTVNHRSNTNQPIHHRHFNNNYGIDSIYTQQHEQLQQKQEQCSSVNMLTIAPNSDLSNRHTVVNTPLLVNSADNSNLDKDQDPSSKYRPKKFYNQSWSLSYQRLLQYFTGKNNRTEEINTTIIIVCVLIIIILLVAITSYTRSNNEPFDNNSIDYGGGEDGKPI